jgi:hypothetical protein
MGVWKQKNKELCRPEPLIQMLHSVKEDEIRNQVENSEQVEIRVVHSWPFCTLFAPFFALFLHRFWQIACYKIQKKSLLSFLNI